MLSAQTCQSSIGKKVIMAVTGLALFGFVVAHLIGNLLIFLGPEALNAYAKKLRDLGPLLWVARISLIVFVLLHIGTAVCLVLENRRARPIPYEKRASRETTYAGRTMMASGLIVLAYISYHLLHFTLHKVHQDVVHAAHHGDHVDVYAMVVLSFQQPLISVVYIAAMALLCLHLKHGLASVFQSIGWNHDRLIPILEKAAFLASMAIFIGYASIPAAVWMGLVKLSGGAS